MFCDFQNLLVKIWRDIVAKKDAKKFAREFFETVDLCPECGSRELFLDSTRGELICARCGLVVREHIVDPGPEWRAFTAEEREKRARTGGPMTPTIHDKGLSTVIDWRDRDALGRKLSPIRRAQIYRLRKWQIRTRVHNSIDRNLTFALAELDRLTSQLQLPKPVKDEAALLYRGAVIGGMIRGRSIEAMIAASVYAACRLHGVPRTLDEISKESRVNKKELGRCYRLLLRRLDVNVPGCDPVVFVGRFGEELNLSGKVLRLAIDIVRRARELGLTAGKDPTGLAAAAIYIAGIVEGERRTQREIAEIAHVTEVTVRNRYKELIKQLDIKIEP